MRWTVCHVVDTCVLTHRFETDQPKVFVIMEKDKDYYCKTLWDK